MLIALFWCAAGLALLVFGAELIVRGGTRLATRLGISPAVIGLTIVAIGTSAPELAIGIDAGLQGKGSLTVGNIAGANIVNILLIFGLSVLIRPLKLREETLWLELPAMVVASFTLLVMAWDGVLSRSEGFVLVAMALFYTAAIVHAARRESRSVQRAFAKELAEGALPAESQGSVLVNLAALSGGIVIVVLGADWLVAASVELARLWGVSDAFIGLSIVAIGTSSPELVTTIVATVRKQRAIAIGNLLGSSVSNILFILGVICIVPSSPIQVAHSLITIDIPVMTAVALACVPVFYTDRKVSRLEGALFVGAYIVYLGYLVMARS